MDQYRVCVKWIDLHFNRSSITNNHLAIGRCWFRKSHWLWIGHFTCTDYFPPALHFWSLFIYPFYWSIYYSGRQKSGLEGTDHFWMGRNARSGIISGCIIYTITYRCRTSLSPSESYSLYNIYCYPGNIGFTRVNITMGDPESKPER